MTTPDERRTPSSLLASHDEAPSTSMSDEIPSLQSRARSNSTSSTSSQSSSASSSSSTSSLPSAAFLPPFYNRPPTPLPPSPSLTSLLRPPFTPSRPLTPESSDSESLHHDHHHTHDHHQHHHHHHHSHSYNVQSSSSSSTTFLPLSSPLPSPRVPTYEYYGFVLYLTSTLSFGIYLLWSYLPESVLNYFGIYYYYNRWWSLAVPAYLVITVLYIFVALAGWNNEIMARKFDELECITDKVAKVAVVEIDEGRHIYNSSSATKNDHGVEQEEIIEGKGEAAAAVAVAAGDGNDDNTTLTPKSSRKKKHKKKKKSKRRGSGWTSGSASENMDEADWYYYGSSTAHEDTDDAEEREGRTGGMKDGGVQWKDYWSTHTDAVLDIPLGGVCEVLYGEGREEW